MDCECALLVPPLLPLPPPLPPHFNTRFHQNGLLITGLKISEICSVPNAINNSWDRLFDEGYRADVSILTDDGSIIYAHTSILGIASPVFKAILKKMKRRGKKKGRSISIRGVPPEAIRVFIRFLYSSRYEEEKLNEYALPLLVLSHAYGVEQLKRLCECWLEGKMINTENVIDIFQIALLCDAPRLSLICHRFIVSNLKAVSVSDGWNDMKKSHPILEKEIVASLRDEDVEFLKHVRLETRNILELVQVLECGEKLKPSSPESKKKKERLRKEKERKVYIHLYEAMEALVHICKDGCRTIGPHDKVLKGDQAPCEYAACKGLEALIRHFAGCKMRGTGGCIHCKRMWQILELHSRLCANSNVCKVPLCSNLRQRRRKQSKKEEVRWRILVKKIVRSKSITGAPYFSLEFT